VAFVSPSPFGWAERRAQTSLRDSLEFRAALSARAERHESTAGAILKILSCSWDSTARG